MKRYGSWCVGGGVEVPVNNRQIGGTDVRALDVIPGRVYGTRGNTSTLD